MARPEPPWRPPLRGGVAPSRVAVPAGPWSTVLAFLQARFPAVADQWPGRIARGEVLGAQGQPLHAGSPCPPPNSLLWYWRSPPPEARLPVEITLLHQCSQLVVVDKPHFLPVTPGGRHLQETVLLRLQQQLGLPGLVPLHRLDRETAGVLAFTVQPAQRAAYHALWRQHQVHKVYEAVAPWRDGLALPQQLRHRLADAPGAGFMQVQVVAGEPNAQTLIELIARLPPTTTHAAAGKLDEPDRNDPNDPHDPSASAAPSPQPTPLAHYRLTPLTGHRHQLRAQLNHLGLPIVGDRIYPKLWPDPPPGAPPDLSNPLQLLARTLTFIDPINGERRHFVSQRRLALVPADMQADMQAATPAEAESNHQ